MTLGERMKQRREILGLSLRALAEKVGVSHTTISKFEKNELVPDSKHLIRLSESLQIPIAALLRPRSQRVELKCFAFRTRKLKKREEKQINEETKEWLERYLQIEKMTESQRTFEMPEGFPRAISSFEDVELAAEDLRVAWDLGMDPIENLTTLLEDKGIKIGIIEGIKQFDALSTEYEGDPIIVVKDGLPRARQRFSLMHEVGHYLLEGEDGLDEEKVMHRFAGAFLVPAKRVLFELSEKRQKISTKELLLLKEKYGLSMGAWVFRAKDLGIITDEEFLSIRKFFSKQGWNTQEPGDDVQGERPIHMNAVVLKAHAEGIISTSKAAELLNQSIATFCSLEGDSDFESSPLVCG
ncbi:MAG: XRE family transcriptional regulator [Methanoregulaceae archaeon]|jgi:Zn-dependent peptidase ImmA (M78 family)/transcriptional regulator with XRE-family HTH domain|nr:XRE family transcriptional regulator [Methanoregulaceae archaeon]